jgi:hypothetical protein
MIYNNPKQKLGPKQAYFQFEDLFVCMYVCANKRLRHGGRESLCACVRVCVCACSCSCVCMLVVCMLVFVSVQVCECVFESLCFASACV